MLYYVKLIYARLLPRAVSASAPKASSESSSRTSRSRLRRELQEDLEMYGRVYLRDAHLRLLPLLSFLFALATSDLTMLRMRFADKARLGGISPVVLQES